jgi:hypothetical protein
MFRSVLLTLALAGVCAAQPPSRHDRIVPPAPFNPEAARLDLIARIDRMIPIIEHCIKANETAVRDFRSLTPEQRKKMQGNVVTLRKILEETKARRQELLDAAPVKPLPVAPMPREKRVD